MIRVWLVIARVGDVCRLRSVPFRVVVGFHSATYTSAADLKVGDLNQGRTVKFWEVKLDQRTVEYRVSEQSFEKRIQHDGRLMSLKDTEQFAKRGQYWPRFCIGLSLDARSTN